MYTYAAIMGLEGVIIQSDEGSFLKVKDLTGEEMPVKAH